MCLSGKQARQPFGSGEGQRSSRILELVHSDVSGPYTPGTYDRKRFFVTFIDDFSHFTVVYLLKSKDEVLECFQEYNAKFTAHFGVKIARIRCDNGGEYTSKAFRTFCRGEGISMEFTAPYTPQQNGVAERMNRTLLDKARSMVFDAGLPKSLWGEAVLTAAYLSNRSPSSALDVQKTPYEVWYNRKPDIDNLRVFGAFAHTHVPKQCRGKLDPRSEKNYMVGYASNGYRIWDPRRRKVFVSRDVIFDENSRKLITSSTYFDDGSEEESFELEKEVEPQPEVEPNNNEQDDGTQTRNENNENFHGTEVDEPVGNSGDVIQDAGEGPSRKRTHVMDETFSDHPVTKRIANPRLDERLSRVIQQCGNADGLCLERRSFCRRYSE